jgi:RelA/SpoT family (p)ppGpp synthetase
MLLKLTKKAASKEMDKVFLGNNQEQDLKELLEECRKNLKKFDEQLIVKAFHWCTDVHKDKVRRSGEPYYHHPLGVAHIVVSEMPLDDISVAAALLHHAITENEQYSMKSLRMEFGSVIAEIVEGIHKIRHIENQNIEQVENYRKFLLAMFRDVRIILVKLADRLHNMRTLGYLPLERQKRIAKETLEVFAPFAQRFGLGSLKWELEDLSFKFLDNKSYNDIKRRLNQSRAEREHYIKKFSQPLFELLKKNEELKANNIQFEISGRPKHIYSIFNKMKAREKPLEELMDLFAVRIILETNDSSYCYATLRALTSLYSPVHDTFKDYISNPKKNGYQSIHMAVYGPEGKFVEVQIRTRAMHEVAEKGVAAHFKYKRGLLPAQTILEDNGLEQWLDLIRTIFENLDDESKDDLLASAKNNIFKDEIFVFTPANEFRTMPQNSTPLDFAYSIHTDIGNRCIGAKINGRIEPLDYKLKSGDQIEIMTSKNQKPSRDWLHCVATQRAKSAITKYFQNEERILWKKGKILWDEILQKNQLKVKNSELDSLLRQMEFKSRESFFAALGKDAVDLSYIFRLLNKTETNGDEFSNGNLKLIKGMQNSQDTGYKKYNANLKDGHIKIRMAQCCYPLPGDKIYMVIDSGKAEIHRAGCKKLKQLEKAGLSNIFDIDWSELPEMKLTSKLRISGEESAALITEITSILQNLTGVAIKSFNFDNTHNLFNGYVTFEVSSIEQINTIYSSLRLLKGIKNIERMSD